MTQLNPTKLHAIEVPENSQYYSVSGGMLSYDPDKNSQHGTWEHCKIGQREFFQILGTITPNEISFDVEGYTEKILIDYPVAVRAAGLIRCIRHMNYSEENQYEHSCENSTDSFRSLLSANGITDYKKLLIPEI